MMWRRSVLPLLISLVLSACSSGGTHDPVTTVSSPVARGALEIAVEPNPIVATNRDGDTYDFPFTVRIREIGGANVEIDEVRMDLIAFGALNVYSEKFGRDDIVKRGYQTLIASNSEVRYSFKPRKEVPDDRLFGQVSAELTAEGRDANGNPVRATARVTLRRE